MNTKYINVHISILDELFELAYAVLYEYPITGIEELTDELVVSFKISDWNSKLGKNIEGSLHKINQYIKITKIEELIEKNWNEDAERDIDPIIVNEKIGITPGWRADEIDSKLKIIINPQMSFGTGHHETTKMVCNLMDGMVEENSFWIDAGTGTGILAILAAKLGAKQVLAFDNDDWSVTNTLDNIKLNDISEDIITVQKAGIDDIEIPKVNGIVANMFLNLLVPNMNKFYDSLHESYGDLIVSGVLLNDVEDLVDAAEKAGFKYMKARIRNKWSAIHFKAL